MATPRSNSSDRQRQRFYLFAGMGGRPARRKHRAFLLGALLLAASVSAGLVALFYWLNTV